ncbi:primase alpha helix C-terminal domain-containing protein [Staphylococcus chromogenes]|uniref:primase alpha helix C-terminal domain-containing protein n=1 Tax=Staphylococcus chromogenes TaxID=46126 RepID=UPI000D19A6FF|nr:primase alpha helix C-terminal domain-containing protein [Staphylococcus chromogenes]PTF68915.1 mobile element-associated protein [Staphylococcus chromogenes]PTF72591.1 mobile element-associated protein [Staphylococcus chromogenes]PTF85071.1 mobile element-associated protein [Staphylococcus chromogenes]PTG34520.1 mobile element-associated protein [Staphylococcus chromogenes]PTG81704.1 mobile element-associated protein [Staphylococcus chromogenes]
MFNLKNDDELHILLYQSLTSKGTENVKNMMWSDWCEFLTRPVVSHDKYANKLAIYGDVADSEGISHRRLKENVMYRQVFSLDYDDIDDMNRFLDNVKNKMKHFAYFIYTTYRHRDTHDENDESLRPRFRLLIPVDDILEPDEYTKYAGALSRYIGEVIDESCLKPIQLSALPVLSSKDAPFHWYINDAPFITREQLDSCLAKYPLAATEAESQNINVVYNKRGSEYWRDIAFGVAEGGRNQTLTSLIGVLLNRRVPDPLVYAYCYMWNENCKPPLSSREFNATFESIYKREHR